MFSLRVSHPLHMLVALRLPCFDGRTLNLQLDNSTCLRLRCAMSFVFYKKLIFYHLIITHFATNSWALPIFKYRVRPVLTEALVASVPISTTTNVCYRLYT